MGDSDLSRLTATAEAEQGPVASAAGELQNELEEAIDSRLEERFIWVVVTTILADALIFSHMENWTGPIVIGLLQLVLLVVLARKWRIEEVSQILAKFLDRAAERTER